MINFKEFRELLLEAEGILGKDRNFEKRTYVFVASNKDNIFYKNSGWGNPDTVDNVIVINEDGVKYLHLKQQDREKFHHGYPENIYLKIRESTKIGPTGDGTSPDHLLFHIRKDSRFVNIDSIGINKAKSIPSTALMPQSLGVASDYPVSLDVYEQSLRTGIAEGPFSDDQRRFLLDLVNLCKNSGNKKINIATLDSLNGENIPDLMGQMKFFGECLGPFTLANRDNDLYRPWGNDYTGSFSVKIPKSANYPLVDFLLYTVSPETGQQLEWNFSSKMPRGNTVKSEHLEKILETDNGTENFIAKLKRRKLAELHRDNNQLWNSIDWVRKICSLLNESPVWYNQIKAASALWANDGNNAIYPLALPEPVNEAMETLRPEPIRETGNVFADILAAYPQLKNYKAGQLKQVQIAPSILSSITGRKMNITKTLSDYARNIRPDGRAYITLRSLMAAAGNYISKSSKNDPNFKQGVRAWFEHAISENIYYMHLEVLGTEKAGYDGLSWEVLGAGEVDKGLPQFTEVFLHAKNDASDRLGFQFKK